MKIVINKCFGGFGLSTKAYDFMGIAYTVDERWNSIIHPEESFRDYDKRTDERLIKCVETLGKAANGPHADLEVIEVPDSLKFWNISDYDGIESLTASESEIAHY